MVGVRSCPLVVPLFPALASSPAAPQLLEDKLKDFRAENFLLGRLLQDAQVTGRGGGLSSSLARPWNGCRNAASHQPEGCMA